MQLANKKKAHVGLPIINCQFERTVSQFTNDDNPQ